MISANNDFHTFLTKFSPLNREKKPSTSKFQNHKIWNANFGSYIKFTRTDILREKPSVCNKSKKIYHSVGSYRIEKINNTTLRELVILIVSDDFCMVRLVNTANENIEDYFVRKFKAPEIIDKWMNEYSQTVITCAYSKRHTTKDYIADSRLNNCDSPQSPRKNGCGIQLKTTCSSHDLYQNY